MTTIHTHPLLTAVEKLLHSHDMEFERDDERLALQFGISADGITWMIHAVVNPDLPTLSFFAISQITVPKSHRSFISPILNEINQRASFGCFFLGGDEAEFVTMRVSLPALLGIDEKTMADFCLSICARAFKELSSPLAVAAISGVTCEEFFAKIDQRSDERSAPEFKLCDDCRHTLETPPADRVKLN